MGFPKGCNQGIKEAKGDNILLLNNDVVVTKNWLRNLIRCLYENEDTGAVGPVTNSAAYYTAIPTFYKDMQGMQNFVTLLEMKRCYWAVSLFGAEINEKAAALANRVAPTTSGEYDKLHEVFTDEKFQYILLSHPIEPAKLPHVIQSISQFLTPTGIFIMSKFNLDNYNALKNS
ncbi:hypothetical protein BWGOE8_08550 [Bacillus mycoides]|uniref:Glycosyltransferase 2-like domain-containing protein n=1 Tax=Bacillus mycoides TaxID=1405 RepID=A0A1E8BC97_BACMY|nr:hypothetical protein BWGOE8_08550 [Bacillus mycoides]OFD84242.1 hypothetical protein BWGOE9_08390 [Bacillus mycoides]OFD86260.1 hypothetical protein BWGOE10_08470 [Bacillus mycoides]